MGKASNCFRIESANPVEVDRAVGEKRGGVDREPFDATTGVSAESRYTGDAAGEGELVGARRYQSLSHGEPGSAMNDEMFIFDPNLEV